MSRVQRSIGKPFTVSRMKSCRCKWFPVPPFQLVLNVLCVNESAMY